MLQPLSLALTIACLLGAQAAWPATELAVSFVEPGHYTDSSHSRAFAVEREQAQVRHAIERHLQHLAARYLRPGQSLHIAVLDIDLAGGFETFRATDLRIVRDVTWPSIELRYTLSEGDLIVVSGSERVIDMNFLMFPNPYPSFDRLRYAKSMLDDWFEKRLAHR